jgi:mono/diheme cytochrome c family protein
MTRPIAWLALALVLAAAAAAAWWWSDARGWHIDHTDAQQVALGKQIYDRHCGFCHGAALEGQPNWQSRDARGRLPAPPHDESGHTWHHDDVTLFEITKFGVTKFGPPGYESDMPAFEGVLTDAEIAAALAYIKSSWPESIHRRRRAANMT